MVKFPSVICGMGWRSNEHVPTTNCTSLELIKTFPTRLPQCKAFFPMPFFTETLDHMWNYQRDPEYSPSWEKEVEECHNGAKVRFLTEQLGVFNIQALIWVQLDLLHSLISNVHIWKLANLIFLLFYPTNPFHWYACNILLKVHFQ